MLGLPGLVVLEVDDVPGEVIVRVESTRKRAVCPSCRRRAEAQDRVEVHLRDLHCFGPPCRLVINKRRWRCRTTRCVTKTWAEKIPGVASRQVLTVRAAAEVTRQVGQLCQSVASVADEYEVGWDTAWAAVELHGTPLVDSPRRAGRVGALGVDEHSYLSATREHSTIYATSVVDLDRRIVIDLFEGKSAAKLRRWCAGGSKTRRSGTAGAKPTRSFASASCCSKETSALTSGAGTRCWPGCASATPTTRCSAHGWPKKLCAVSTSWTIPTKRPCCSTTPLPRADPTNWPRSAP
jgi:transposase